MKVLLNSFQLNILDDHLSKHSLKNPAQWGFAKGLSAEGMLLSLTNRWKMELDKGLTVGAIFVDFRKAFDSLSHNILSLKLQAVGICGNLHEWLMNYLSDRCQCTLVNGYISDLTLVQYGIPQGSLLGPRLYTIYVNDLPDAITLGNVLMYADDTTLYCIGKSFDEVCLKLNKVFDELRLWSLRPKLSIHPIKTEAMILTKQGFIGPALPIVFGDKYVNVVDHTTCLGLTIDNCLSWSKHVCHIKKHFSQKVGALKRMRQLPPKVLEEIYFKSIIPAVIYGIVVWGNCSSAMLNSLNPIHDRAARLIHDQDDLQSLNWLPLSYFYKRRLLLFMFDVIKHNVPDDLASLFTLKSGSRPSRRGSQFVIPRVKYEIRKQSIQYRGPTIWTFLNRLININESISKDKFKQILRRFSKDINNFSFRAPMIANKHDHYVYF